MFESRFRDQQAVDFPLRQYLRCRDDLMSGAVHAVLLAAFVVTLVAFTRTLHGLFATHGAHLNPWFERCAFLLMIAFALSVLRRLYYKLAELRSIRREMRELKSSLRGGDNQEVT